MVIVIVIVIVLKVVIYYLMINGYKKQLFYDLGLLLNTVVVVGIVRHIRVSLLNILLWIDAAYKSLHSCPG